jgi:hypothetical protein
MNKPKRMNFGFEMQDEEDYIVPSKEEIMLQWLHELEHMEPEEAKHEIEEI